MRVKIKMYVALLVLRMKQAVTFMPRAILGTVLFIILLVLGTIGIKTTSELGGAAAEKLKVAICLDTGSTSTINMPIVGDVDESVYIKMAVDYVGSMDSVKNIGEFEYCDDETAAVEKLKNGEYAAVAVIPSDFISKIISGNGRPARIIFAGSGTNVSSALFQEMIKAGAEDVSSAQIGIYAVDDMINEYFNGVIKLYQAEMELNAEYFSYALDRSVYITTEYVSGGRGLSVVQSFVCTGIMVIMAMGGVLSAQCLYPDKYEFRCMLRQRRIPAFVSFLTKVIAVSLVSSVIYAVIYLLVCLSAMRYPDVAGIITAVDGFSAYTGAGMMQAFGNIFKGMLCMVAAVVINYVVAALVYALSIGKEGTQGDGFSGIIVLCIINLLMFLASGCLIAQALLPDWIARIGSLLPAKWIHDLVKVMLIG